jgi:1,4-alpha-glucan branching enzyme
MTTGGAGAVSVEFRYLTGLKGARFRNARLRGSWDAAGRFVEPWQERAMTPFVAEDGCPAFRAVVPFDAAEVGKTFRWGVAFDTPSGSNVWGIATELARAESTERYREFTLEAAPNGTEDYYLTFSRRLGARKFFGQNVKADLRFAVWAPNAQSVDVVFSERGYVGDDGSGIDATRPAIPLARGAGGIWTSAVVPSFSAHRGLRYMYRIVNEQGNVTYRTDIFSRAQFGRGSVDPEHQAWDGSQATLDGSKSCSVIVGQDTIASDLAPGAARVSRAVFWQDEFSPLSPVPTRLEDLVIYELHLGALGFGTNRPGNLRDGIAFLPHLAELGVNAIELMPLAEFSGAFGWGYGDTHHLVIESSAGTLDDYKFFVRACHRLGMIVIQDVCYNHYDAVAERAQSNYDSTLPEHNIYYWYEGSSADHAFPRGGYLENGSSGDAPRYHEEVVRQQFISSAALLVDECHVDGFRVDLTQAFHRDNVQIDGGFTVNAANRFGQKLLREWSRTLRLLKPDAFLIAEDHTGWNKVTEPPDAGGLGFTARWDAAYYHHLIGDSDFAGGRARLLNTAGLGGDEPLDLFTFAGALYETQFDRVVYHEGHDEAGNAGGTARTLVTAVNGAALFGATRDFAEARARVAFLVTLLSAGTPMFFMGEETGASKPYRFNDFKDNREDIVADKAGTGAKLFRFYREAIAFARARPAARSRQIDVIHANPEGRVLAFTRRAGSDQLLVVASLGNRPYLDGYVIGTAEFRLGNGAWREVFNSDAGQYGGAGIGNFGAAIPAAGGRFQARLPANGVLVFRRE